MLNLESIKTSIRENGKIGEIFQLSEGYVNLLIELGFEYDYDSNRFITHFENNSIKYKTEIYKNNDNNNHYFGITIRKESNSGYDWYANFYHAKDETIKSKDMSPMGLIYWLEYQIKKLEPSVNKTFTKFIEIEKNN